MGEAKQRFWEAKLASAKAEHATELRKMSSGGGASLRRLERLSRAISKAMRELDKLKGGGPS